jgi:catechol 2,3-dioxygenase-like lactoylglutathione lyase family enzyme
MFGARTERALSAKDAGAFQRLSIAIVGPGRLDQYEKVCFSYYLSARRLDMPVTVGAHHLTLFTHDMDRFIRFYEEIFDAETKFDLSEPGPGGRTLRHSLIDVGGGFALHPFQMPEPTGYEDGSMQMGKRGHIDHLALKVDDEAGLQEIRRRLVKAGASDGTITDFGAIRLVTFRDPDGMEGEVARWTDSKRVLRFDERKREIWPD